jgi:hypothetical protein
MRLRTPRLAALLALTLAACAPTAPPGVDKGRLDDAVSQAIGDPASCLLISKAGGGGTLYRYNTATACGRTLPACDGPGQRTVTDLLKATAADGKARTLSCDTLPDGSRGVGWAAGPIEGTDLVYAAMMEGDRAFPGRMMADRLEGAFRRAGVSKSPTSPAQSSH